MSSEKKNPFGNIIDMAKNSVSNIDMNAIKDNATKAGEFIADKAVDLKDSAVDLKDEISDKITELDRMLQSTVTEYNDAYTLMNDNGVKLFVERSRSIDVLSLVESLVNSIANHPKTIDKDIEQIQTNRETFSGSCDYAERELQSARKAVGSAGAGAAAGAAVAFMAPIAAMWIATTFGTASTGAAISTLSGAAATNAALAWIGGGAVAAGGGGMAAGNAFLAMAGPIGWAIAGATLLTSIVLFTKSRMKLNKEKSEEIEIVKKNTEAIKEMDALIKQMLTETINMRDGLKKECVELLKLYGEDYVTFNEEQKLALGALVNNAKALSASMNNTINTEISNAE